MAGFHLRAAAAALMLIVAGPATAGAQTHRPTRYVLFLDCSPSVTADQQQRWTQQGRGQIAKLAAGDALQIFLLHDNTAAGAEVFGREAPAADTFSARRALVMLRQDGQKALACPSGQGRGKDTDVLSAIDRVHPDGSRDTIVIFFSDMLNSTPEADIERLKLHVERMPQIIKAAAGKHRWTGDTLQGVRVLCVLNSLNQGQRSPSPNDRRTIETFYRTLFEAVGGRLERFDTALPSLSPVNVAQR